MLVHKTPHCHKTVHGRYVQSHEESSVSDKAYRGNRDIAQLILKLCTKYRWANPGANWIRSSGGFRASLNISHKRLISCTCRDSNPWSTSPCLNHYTDWITPDYLLLSELNWKLIRSAVCLTTGPQTLPQKVLHRVRSSATSFHLQYPLFYGRSSTSCLLLLRRLPVTYILRSPSLLQ